VSAKRRAAGKKAARTKAAKHAARVAAGKKAARTRKRREAAKKTARKTTRRKTTRKTTRRKTTRKKKMSKATRDKISRALKRHHRKKTKGNPMAKRRRRKKTTRKRRRRTKRNPPVSKKRGGMRKRRRRRSPSRSKRPLGRPLRRGKRQVRFKSAPRRGARRRVYKIRKKPGRAPRVVVGNPIKAMGRMLKDGAYTFAGVLAIRALGYTLQKHVFSKSTALSTGTMAMIAPVLPSAAGLLLAALAPKMKLPANLTRGLQAGATLVFFDAILTQFLKKFAPTASPYLLPGAVAGYGLHEYVGAPMGLEVEEAMALNEYVANPAHQLTGMGGFDVEEALAMDEQHQFESGYAGGSMRGTVFGTW
jgi:hypothetical protein